MKGVANDYQSRDNKDVSTWVLERRAGSLFHCEHQTREELEQYSLEVLVARSPEEKQCGFREVLIALVDGCIQDKNRLDKNIRKAGVVMEARQESTDTGDHRQVTNKLSSCLTDPLRPEFDNSHKDRSDIHRCKTSRHVQSVIPTAIRTHSGQAGSYKHLE